MQLMFGTACILFDDDFASCASTDPVIIANAITPICDMRRDRVNNVPNLAVLCGVHGMILTS